MRVTGRPASVSEVLESKTLEKQPWDQSYCKDFEKSPI
jgi:hypothetical protein